MLREIRPRFAIRRPEPDDLLVRRLAKRLRYEGCPVCGFASEERCALYVPPERQRLWSAELRVDVSRRGSETVLECRYAPHPHVWVTYVIVLAAVAVGITVAVVFGLAQWSMNDRPTALYGLVPLLLVGAAAYGAAFVGQGFATDEMDELRVFLEEALADEVPLHSHVRNLKPGADSAHERTA